jgi:hypothetical protein
LLHKSHDLIATSQVICSSFRVLYCGFYASYVDFTVRVCLCWKPSLPLSTMALLTFQYCHCHCKEEKSQWRIKQMDTDYGLWTFGCMKGEAIDSSFFSNIIFSFLWSSSLCSAKKNNETILCLLFVPLLLSNHNTSCQWPLNWCCFR